MTSQTSLFTDNQTLHSSEQKMLLHTVDGKYEDSYDRIAGCLGCAEAVYTPQILDRFKGNLLIEALPDFLGSSRREIIKAMERSPSPIPTGATRTLLNAWLSNLASELYIPSGRNVDLLENIDLLMRQGYSRRHPVPDRERVRLITGPKSNTEDSETNTNGTTFRMNGRSHDPLSISLIGCSGVGKTCAVRSVLGLIPQQITHTRVTGDDHFTQLTYLFVECPADGSAKALCLRIISEIDHITGMNFRDLFARGGRTSAEALAMRVEQLMQLYNVGLLCIDECQNLANTRGNRSTLFNFIVSMCNSVSVPMVFIGTPAAQKFMQKDLRIARRFGSFGALNWERYEKDGTSWKMFTSQLWGFSGMVRRNGADAMPQDISDAFYRYSGGISDILIKLYIISQKMALVHGMKELNTKLIESTFSLYFSPLRPIIDAINTGRLDQYDDLALITDLQKMYSEANKATNKEMETSEFGKETPAQVESDYRDRIDSIFRNSNIEMTEIRRKVMEDWLADRPDATDEEATRYLIADLGEQERCAATSGVSPDTSDNNKTDNVRQHRNAASAEDIVPTPMD
ncbi:MAG: ATP-binding protein [Succinimonas sp.]|nr:ATP-binding protein [Succinimonas sp.]